MTRIEDLLGYSAKALHLQKQYDKVNQDCEEATQKINAEISELSAKLASLIAKKNEISSKFYEPLDELDEKLDLLQDKARSSLSEMLASLFGNQDIEKFFYEADISSVALIEAVTALPAEDSTSQFIIDLLMLTSVDGSGQVVDLHLQFDMQEDSIGTLGINTSVENADIEFDLEQDTDNGNEMINISLIKPVNYDPHIEKREEFKERALVFPTINKLVVLGFFVNLALESK